MLSLVDNISVARRKSRSYLYCRRDVLAPTHSMTPRRFAKAVSDWSLQTHLKHHKHTECMYEKSFAGGLAQATRRSNKTASTQHNTGTVGEKAASGWVELVLFGGVISQPHNKPALRLPGVNERVQGDAPVVHDGGVHHLLAPTRPAPHASQSNKPTLAHARSALAKRRCPRLGGLVGRASVLTPQGRGCETRCGGPHASDGTLLLAMLANRQNFDSQAEPYVWVN